MHKLLEEAYDISTKNDLELLEDDLDDLLDKLEREGYGVWAYKDSLRGYGFNVYSAKRKLTKDEDVYYFFTVNLNSNKVLKYKTLNPNILDGKLVSEQEFSTVDELDTILHNEIESINPQNTIIDAQIEEDLTDEEQSLLDRIDKFITKLYELRQSSIKEEGEFGTGNLVFKEFRNLGYLDNLKKLKTKLQGKEMSLEGLKEELNESKTFRFPKELTDKVLDYYKNTYSTLSLQELPIKQLVDDNDLLNDDDLQSYHQRQWGNAKAKDFHIDQDKINNMRPTEVPFVVLDKDEKLKIVDGRHRIRALYNDGYDYVEVPTVVEDLKEEWITHTSKELNESTDTEEYKFYEMLTKISGQLQDSQKLARLYPSLNKEVIDKFNEINSRYDKAQDNASRNEISLEATSLMDEVLNNKEKYLKGLDQGISDSNIDLMLEEMLKLPQHELLDKCGMGDTFDKPELVGPMFILDDGSFVYVSHYISGDVTHLDFVKQMIYNYAKNVYPNVGVDFHLYNTSENFMTDLLKKGWIRCNTGSSASDKRFYCVLPDKNDYKPTNEQFYSLAYFLDLNDTDRVLVFCGDYESRYYYKEDGSDYIVNRIKRYYNDGELREDLDDTEKDLTVEQRDRLQEIIDRDYEDDGKSDYLFTIAKGSKVIGDYLIKAYTWIFDASEDREEETIDWYKSDFTPEDWNYILYGKEESQKESLVLKESKQDKENFKKWITQKVEDKYAGMPSGNKEAFINNWVNNFEEDKSALKPPLNDYYYWIKKDDFDAFTSQMFHLNIDKENKQKAKDGAQLLYNKDGWQVYKITNYQASAKYGKGTRWCISGSKRWTNNENGEKYWNEYSEAGVTFYFFINGNRKYALAIYPDNTTYEIFDDGDNSLGYIPNAPIIEEIPVDYTSKNDYREFYNAVASAKLPDWQYIYGRVYSELTSGEKDDVDILDKDTFLDYVDSYLIPDGYIEHDACKSDLITPEEYEELTGEDYEEEWSGDLMSNGVWELIDASAVDIITKEQAMNYIAKSLKDAKYIIYDRYSGDVESFDNYEDLIVYIIQNCYEWDNYKDGFDQFVDSCINITRLLIKQGEENIDDFTKLGISKEFLEKEE